MFSLQKPREEQLRHTRYEGIAQQNFLSADSRLLDHVGNAAALYHSSLISQRFH